MEKKNDLCKKNCVPACFSVWVLSAVAMTSSASSPPVTESCLGGRTSSMSMR